MSEAARRRAAIKAAIGSATKAPAAESQCLTEILQSITTIMKSASLLTAALENYPDGYTAPLILEALCEEVDSLRDELNDYRDSLRAIRNREFGEDSYKELFEVCSDRTET